MLPQTKVAETKHRVHKRHLEIEETVRTIQSLVQQQQSVTTRVLEFGCGDGFQIPYLQKLGQVIASDLYRSPALQDSDVEFYECDITRTPFPDDYFDVIFSNHVIEHIADLQSAFVEMQRIGRANCIYAFSVPTNMWLLLSLPTQYYHKVRTVFSKYVIQSEVPQAISAEVPNISVKKRNSLYHKAKLILPLGHGVRQNFIQCYQEFRISHWQQLVQSSGFSLIEVKPLLLYGPSEWPIIPTIRPFSGVCSSVLLLARKA